MQVTEDAIWIETRMLVLNLSFTNTIREIVVSQNNRITLIKQNSTSKKNKHSFQTRSSSKLKIVIVQNKSEKKTRDNIKGKKKKRIVK
jgi:hypothetical protein